MSETYLTTVELAERLKLRRQTLDVWRCHGRGPRYLKVGRRVVYRASDVERWLESRAIACDQTAAAGVR